MKYAHLNYDDPLIEIIENALFVIKNVEFTDLSPSEQKKVRRNAISVFAKLESKSDKITASNIATMYHAVENFHLILKDNRDFYYDVFPSPELSLPSYLNSLEAAGDLLRTFALDLGYELLSISSN